MSGNTDEPGGGDDGNEPRAKEMQLDASTMMALRSWFDLPSFADLEEQQDAAQAEAREKTATEKVLEARNNALANIQPGFVASLERRRAGGAGLTRIAVQQVRWERRLLAFDEARVPPAVDLDDYPEVHVPNALIKDLKTCTPQAFLRDLHRPAKEFYVHMQSPFEDEGEPPGPDPLAPIREVLRASHRVGAVAPAVAKITADIDGLRALLAAPWADSKRERARQREAELLGKEAAERAVTQVPEGAP